MDAGVRKRLLRVLRQLAAIVLIVATPYVACHEYYFWWYQQRFPEKIAVDKLIFDLYTPGVRTDNAIGILRISEETANAIKREGLAFFDNATTARGDIEPASRTSVAPRLVLPPWRETPFPINYPPEIARSFPALSFARERNGGQRFYDQITDASTRPGSFYTTRGRAMWFVALELRFAVLMYW